MRNKHKDHTKMSIRERIRYIEEIIIIHPLFQKIFNAISECHERSKIMAEPQCFFITGKSGAGKSTLIKYYTSRYPRKITREGTIIPVLSSEILASATPKGIATGILLDLGDPLADRGTQIGQMIRVFKLVEECKVELIILDEFQRLIDDKSNLVIKKSAELVRDLVTRTNVPVVLVGMPESDMILGANEQLKRRFTARRDLTPFKFHTDGDIMNFRKLLQLIDKKLPLSERSQLADPDMALRFYLASRGLISGVMKLVSKAAELAMEQDYEKIMLDHLAEAYEAISALGQENNNPFLLDRKSLEKKREELIKGKEEDKVESKGGIKKKKSKGGTISKAMKRKIHDVFQNK
jgi:Cdc6-like AAA superfamily ATPase